mmetsp:Transcript_56787/g.139651  ORF Transcript_56787/g.139651 Transcript_56787/m.139651 type:complete len:200 (+) Transcript_56787:353-952(+)
MSAKIDTTSSRRRYDTSAPCLAAAPVVAAAKLPKPPRAYTSTARTTVSSCGSACSVLRYVCTHRSSSDAQMSSDHVTRAALGSRNSVQRISSLPSERTRHCTLCAATTASSASKNGEPHGITLGSALGSLLNASSGVSAHQLALLNGASLVKWLASARGITHTRDERNSGCRSTSHSPYQYCMVRFLTKLRRSAPTRYW